MSGTIAGNPWPITNRSGTITTGGASQQLMAANPQRRGMWVQNVSAGALYINGFGAAAATQPSILIPPNGLYEADAGTTPTSEIQIFGATTGQAFSAREW
jgi:hypothetical protein